MAEKEPKILNINVGILGHIDSGKTSLSKVLSTIDSTASFDKNPQSQARGITLDLGISGFILDVPETPKNELEKLLHSKFQGYDQVQFTLVDCPGHASLIRTIIGGAQIIDMMILVIDATKGIQTQTAEGIVIGELTTKKLVVALNKIDLFPQEKREMEIKKVTTRLQKTLATTQFHEPAIVPICASPTYNSAEKGDTNPNAKLENKPPEGIDQFILEIVKTAQAPQRSTTGPFLLSVDHCFSIKGQGTVLTGTVLRGSIKINEDIEVPHLKFVKPIKSIQVFRKPVKTAIQGDRVGICVKQLDPKQVERALACLPGSVPTIVNMIAQVSKIRFFKFSIKSKSKFHITSGHSTVLGEVVFFKKPQVSDSQNNNSSSAFSLDSDFLWVDELTDNSKDTYASIRLESSIICPADSLVIGSKLDTDIHSNVCRLAFSGHILSQDVDRLQIYKEKQKKGSIERVMDEYTLLCKDLFKKETDISVYKGLKVVRESNGAVGTIEGSFGKSGKFKVNFPSGGQTDTQGALFLNFKRYMFTKDKKRKIIQ